LSSLFRRSSNSIDGTPPRVGDTLYCMLMLYH
jgi:hypothetical protein